MERFKFKKKFGQNFINDLNVITKIVKLSNVDKDTLVIEIGAGSGNLTKELCDKAGFVISYEIDKDLEKTLEVKLNDYNNKQLIIGDFLLSNVAEEIKKYDYKKIYVVANLPYYITTPIVTKIINENLNIDKLVIMVQKEVGNRFNAKPGTKSYGSLTIFINYFYDVSKLMDVSRNVFTPKPNVDSIVICLDKKEKKYEVLHEDVFFKLVRDSFQFKRKTIRNNLKDYDLDIIGETLKKHNLDLSVRAERLPGEIFADISNAISKKWYF